MDGVQMTIYDFLSPPKPATELPCDKCLYDDMGCCWYDTKDDYCVMGSKAAYTLEDLDEQTMVSRIGERTGLKFTPEKISPLYEPAYTNYKAKYKTATIDVDYSEYDTGDEKHGKRYIGVGYWNPKEKRGSGSPCDSLDEAVEKIQGYIRQIDEANEKVYELDIRGICDDAYCPKCDYGFMDSETDAERCPKCGVKVSWKRWHEINDTEEKVITEKCNTCKYKVWLHGEKTKQSCDYNGGHGGCHYEPREVTA